MSLYRLSKLVLRVVLGVAAGLAIGCTPTTDLNEPTESFGGRGRVWTTQGSAVAVTGDKRIAVVTNRTDGIVSIFRLDPRKPDELLTDKPPFELAFPPLTESKPWAAVIGPDDDTAYVLLRNSGVGPGQVVKVVGLHSSRPREAQRVPVGSEPTSIIITPSGKRLFVANSNEGNLSLILTQNMEEAIWHVNDRLAAAGLLGPSVVERPALAHPRALAITDNGDNNDDDETIYATEFFSQPIADATGQDPDRERQGLIYPFDLQGAPPLVEGKEVPIITLGAVVDTGFPDAEGNSTGCFPNQLYAAAAHGNRLFVTSVCASPAGPVDPGPSGEPTENNNFKTLVHSVIHSVDTTKQVEVLAERVLMNKQLDDAFAVRAASGTPVEPRMPLIPIDIAVVSGNEGGGRDALVSAFGASAVFKVHYDHLGQGTVDLRYIPVGEGLPTGVAVISPELALVVDDLAPRLGTLDLVAGEAGPYKFTIDSQTDPTELVDPQVRHGRNLFATGLRSWSFEGAAWSSCESCHPEGHSDGVTWRFARGPRRSISTAGTYYRDESRSRMLLWTANVDEVHDVEAIARGVSGGVGGVVWDSYSRTHPHKNCRLVYDGTDPKSDAAETFCRGQVATDSRLTALNGSLAAITAARDDQPCVYDETNPSKCNLNRSPDWDDLDAFIRSVRAPRAPTTLSDALVSEGRELFETLGCVACHSGPGWTLSRVFYEPGGTANGTIPSKDLRTVADPAAEGLDEPGLAGLIGELRLQQYRIPVGMEDVQPMAVDLLAPFRSLPKNHSKAGLLAQVYGVPPAPDQVNCVLRSVGTFGISPVGGPVVSEVRRVLDVPANPKQYVDKPAIGTTGFNIPSLVGLAGGGPYFHAGNARTLEEVFDTNFAGHHSALGHAAPTPTQIEALVSYLLSIDEYEFGDDRKPIDLPAAYESYDLCAQFDASGMAKARPAFWASPAPSATTCKADGATSCQNPTDCPMVTSGAAHAAAGACARKCVEGYADACLASCLAPADKLSAGCAECYSTATKCVVDACPLVCTEGSGQDAAACEACAAASGCNEAFLLCSGLSGT